MLSFMKRTSVYSFKDLSGIISHPLTGSYSFTGGGIGQILITTNGDETEQEISTDGDILISRIPFSGGRLSIQCQQNSTLHSWLLSTYFEIKDEDSKQWARMAAILRNIQNNLQREFKGISFTKIPDESFLAEGSMINWVLSFAEYSVGPEG